MGLLSRASHLDSAQNNPGLAFSDFIQKHSIKSCALLEKEASDYLVTNSIGFDACSVLSAKATADFWEGICKNPGEIYAFSGDERTKLLQLFSINLKDNIHELSVYKNSSSQILLFLGKLSKEAASDFENISSREHQNDVLTLNPLIKDGSVVLLFNIDCSNAIKKFYDSISKSNNIAYDYFLKTVLNEIYNRFTCIYSIPDTSIKNTDHSIKTVLVTDKTYSVELITHHMILNLKEVLEDYAEDIQISFEGTADSCDTIQSFLQAE